MKTYILWFLMGFGAFAAAADNAAIMEKACGIGHNLKCYDAAVAYEKEGNKEKAIDLYKKACDAKIAKACEKLKSLQ